MHGSVRVTGGAMSEREPPAPDPVEPPPATLSSSRTGDRKRGDDNSDIGSTDEMTGSTGGLAGSSR